MIYKLNLYVISPTLSYKFVWDNKDVIMQKNDKYWWVAIGVMVFILAILML
jgi:hypothetical protein